MIVKELKQYLDNVDENIDVVIVNEHRSIRYTSPIDKVRVRAFREEPKAGYHEIIQFVISPDTSIGSEIKSTDIWIKLH